MLLEDVNDLEEARRMAQMTRIGLVSPGQGSFGFYLHSVHG